MKKLLSILLVVCIIFPLFPLGLYSITASVATNGITGECAWSLDDTVLTISGSGKMGNYYSSSPWGTSITEVIIEEGVTTIGNSAFYKCSSLTSINIPDSVTSIGERAFYECYSLSSINIPDSVTNIGDEAFYRCSSLTSITIPDSVTSIGECAFSSCSSLTSITIGNGLTNIGSMAFGYCYSIESLYITDLKQWCNIEFKSVYYDLMYYVDKLYINGEELCGKVVIPDGTIRIPNYIFYGCTDITSVVLPDSVTSISGYAFYGCSSLTSVNIPDGVTSIGSSAFSDCSSLTSINIPDSVTSIGSYAFFSCGSLASVYLPNSVTSIGDSAFYNCYNLDEVWYGGTKSNREKIKFGDSNSNLISATWYYEICNADEHVFSNCYDKTCANCEWTREDGHIFDNPCDTSCNVCAFTRTTEHSFTLKDNHTCEKCKLSLKPNAPTLADKFGSTVILQKHTGFEYSSDGVTWQNSNEFTNLNSGTNTFYQRVKASFNALQSETSEGLTVTVKTFYISKPEAPVLLENKGNTVTLKPIENGEYSLDGVTWQKNNVFEDLLPVTKYTFYQRYPETDTYEASETSDVLTVITDKLTLKTPNAPTVKSVSEDTVILNKVEGCEYSLDGVNWQKNSIFDCLLSGRNYTFYQRYKETDTQYASQKSEGLVVKTAGEAMYIPGDVNCDTQINVSDLAQLKKYIAGLLNTSESASCNPDVDNNGTVNVSDLATLKKTIAGLL